MPRALTPPEPARPEPDQGRRRWPTGLVGARGSAAAAVGVLVLAVAGAAAALTLTGGSPSSRGRPPGPTHRSAHSRRPAAPPPAPAVLAPVAHDATGASYRAPTGQVSLTLSASGPCWVEASATPSSPVLWTGTLTAGSSHTLTTAAPLWIRVGDAAHISLTLGGSAVSFPSPGSSPYDFTFAPSVA